MTKILRIGAIAFAFAAVPFTAALADRAPTALENAEIGNILFTEGFTSWGRIELDDGEWHVDNAIDQDGRVRDITLDMAFMIIDSEEDEDDDIVGVRPLN
jgi:hypothetical protein